MDCFRKLHERMNDVQCVSTGEMFTKMNKLKTMSIEEDV